MTENYFTEVLEKEYNGTSPRELSPLVLAYIGDAVYEMLARTMVLSLGNRPVNKMNAEAKKIVNAKSQSEAYFKIRDALTEDEAAIFRRGRNANSYTHPKNMDINDYRHATGLEALFGYLYLSGQNERITELFRLIYKTDKELKGAQDMERPFNENQLEGRNAVLEVLKSGRDIEKIIVQKGNVEGTIRRIAGMARERGIVVQEAARQKLDEMSQTKNHQGVIAIVSEHEYAEVDDILRSAAEKGEKPFIIILDNITDPHNLGAVIRTAECAGAHGVIIPKRRSVGLTAVVGKTSAGALEYMPVARVTNIARTIEELKKQGVWVACADMDGEDYYDASLDGAIALVIGSEGEGVSRLVKEKCDFTVSIPMYGKISSLNASVAGALLMYEVVRQRNYKD